MSCIHNFYGTCNLSNKECELPSSYCPTYQNVKDGFCYRCIHLSDNCNCKLSNTKCLTDSPECKDYHTYPYKQEKKEPVKYCKFCFNARIYKPTEEEMMNPFNTELTDENDSSSCGVGTSCNNTRLMISSGYGEPVRIEIDKFFEDYQEWHTVGKYYPKYCPECGRRLDEYEKSNNND